MLGNVDRQIWGDNFSQSNRHRIIRFERPRKRINGMVQADACLGSRGVLHYDWQSFEYSCILLKSRFLITLLHVRCCEAFNRKYPWLYPEESSVVNERPSMCNKLWTSLIFLPSFRPLFSFFTLILVDHDMCSNLCEIYIWLYAMHTVGVCSEAMNELSTKATTSYFPLYLSVSCWLSTGIHSSNVVTTITVRGAPKPERPEAKFLNGDAYSTTESES